MELWIGYIGFLLAAYSVIANDVIQTLGTFISSNNKTNWKWLWLFSASILFITIVYGWYNYSGDVSYGRLEAIPLPAELKWWYLLAPISLLVITHYGVPVSTTFMILSVFSTGQVIEKMILKSVMGYAVAFVAAMLLYLLISKAMESESSLRLMRKKKQKKYWLFAQWCSTAFLWSQWLIQDFANIYVFLPRQLSFTELMVTSGVILALMAFIFYNRGGKIQQMVTKKANTQNIRSATIIDLSYGLILFVFGNISSIPMSTTWVFIGILAGREMAISYLLHKTRIKETYGVIFKDLAKVNLGLIISIIIAYIIGLINV